VPRVISFIVLLTIVLLVGAVFFQVMAQFLVPLFLACVLLVVFQPLHAWTLRRMPGHPRLGALITTVIILLMVLLPLTYLGWNAYRELITLYKPNATTNVTANATAKPTNPTDDSAARPTEATEAAPAAATASLNGDAKTSETPQAKAFMDRLKLGSLKIRDKLEQTTGIKVEDDEVLHFLTSAQAFVAAKVISGVQSAVKILIGLAIMVIALYYFLADGPGMIHAAMQLSPLDPAYEEELLKRFGDVSRAVVVATLLSAIVQGSLAGIGYTLALPHGAPIFLLTAVTMVTALVPFVGAAAMWVSVCVWIYFYGEQIVDGKPVYDGDPTTAIILAIYCTIIVSGIDNIIKPFILHGQSKLHPLLALLSILGGLQVLGPVGIIVGPMLVSFLQALLEMLRKELESFGGETAGELAVVTGPVKTSENALQDAAGTIVAAPAKPPDNSNAANAKTPAAAAKRGILRRAKRKR
jgi:predicted PurR-regulated permease PerM